MRKSLAKQIFVYFFVLVFLSMSTVGIFSYMESARAIDKQVEKYFTTVINNAAMQTDRQLMMFERMSVSILSQQQVKKFLDMDPDDSYVYYQFSTKIQKDIFEKIHIMYPNQINMMYVLGYHGRTIFDANQNFSAHSVDTSDRLKELDEQTEANGRISILSTSLLPQDADRVITVARKIRGYSTYDIKGVLAIEFHEEQLTDLWDLMDLGEDGFFFILDGQGQVVYAPDDDRVDSPFLERVSGRIVENGEQRFVINDGEQERLIVSRKSEYSGWSLAIAMPLDELREPISAIRTTTVTVGLLTLAAALVLALRFGRTIVSPIRILMNGMRETEKGNWQYVQVKPRKDEVGALVHSYNLMVGRLSEMIDRVYDAELKGQKAQLELRELQLERHRAEYQALQLQINPHFLYNTLETINCYAIVQDSDDISEMVEALAYMLRYSVQTNLEESTIVNELNHVRNYMIILKHRIGREFEVDVVMKPELLLKGMVRLTLQPIVENIFQHAFPNGIETNHFIRIDAKQSEGRIVVTVEDNGAGMSEERLRKLRQRLLENRLSDEQDISGGRKRGGIGVLNVHRRLQMVYGDEFGISVDSQDGQGTIIYITMPDSQSIGVHKEITWGGTRNEH
ncbi:sensor histidine kinase [Paenibacillus soyae]|uniref:histidine kinase n=1 Tax=Paenibacillus soyae TaxID=2969249 RepID=A0A9X2MMB8_9BACL|nr:histidine kinase [Paenibacillus soyae]MCR2802697.1 histidine kinase [Paenibacillus soyae]